jgi:hypothetical protein
MKQGDIFIFICCFIKKGVFSMKKTVLASFCVALLINGGAMAASTYQLDPVVVTANRVEQKAFDAPANISVVTAKEIQDRHYSDLGDVLKDIPGVNVQNYGVSGENYSANRMYINGSKGIVFMVDGMRVNVNGMSSGILAGSEFPDMKGVERIEVLKGASSTLYGSDAAGGVVNIITKKGGSGIHSSLGLKTGSYGNRNIVFNTRGSVGDFFYRASALKNKMGNYTDAVGEEILHRVNANNYSVTIGHQIDKESFVSLTYDKYLSNYTRPDAGKIVGDPSMTPVNGEKDNSRIALNWTQKLDDRFSNQFFVYQNENKLKDGTNQPADENWIFDLSTTGVTEQITYKDDKNTGIFGVDYYKDKVNDYCSHGDKYGPLSLSNKSVFLQDAYEFAPNWTITPGVRYTDNSRAGSKVTKNVTVNYNDGDMNVYGAYKEYFIVPTQNQWFGKYGNPDLKPMTGKGIELGMNYRVKDDLLLTLNLHHMKSENAFGYDANWKIRNVAKEESNGYSIGMEKVVSDNLSVKGDYTYTYMPAENSSKNINGDGYIPQHQVNIDVDYTKGKFQGILTARGMFNRPGRKVNENKVPDSMKSFWVVDATMNYQATENMSAYFKINNIFDKLYTHALYIAIPNVKENTKNWYPAPGRNFQFGMEFKF